MENSVSRRALVKSSIFGILSVSIPSIAYSNSIKEVKTAEVSNETLFHRYPSIDDKIVQEVVSRSHFDLDRIMVLVDARPELARATWDWGFGDWESAIGAASHIGRRDIIAYLMSKGARANIFSMAAMGAYDAVKAMIEASPGIQAVPGPHGISLLAHAKFGLRPKNLSTSEKDQSNKLIAYLESLGNADNPDKYLEVEESEKQIYLGDFMYGDQPHNGFSVQLNMRKMLSLGKIGEFGGALYQIEKNVFNYNGTPSVKITFEFVEDKVVSLTIHEPELTVIARKV